MSTPLPPADDPRRLLLRLYGEDPDPEATARALDRREDLRAEFDALRATKQALDRARAEAPPPPRPDDGVMATIFAAAADARLKRPAADAAPRADRRPCDRAVPMPRPDAVRPDAVRPDAVRPDAVRPNATERTAADRAPRRLERRPAAARVLRWAGSALALLLVAGLGVWQVLDPGLVGPAAEAPGAGVAVADGRAPAAEANAQADGQAAPRAPGATARADTAVPEWDEGDDLVRLHRRLELIEARSTPDEWGALAVSPVPAYGE
jgi:hypothetical protein